ncbi:MAG: DUF4163 domain-containing protein [Bacteroidota bacterium]
MKLKQSSAFLLIIALAALAACAKLKEKPVVDFVMKDFKVESSPNCREDSACAVFQIQYPEFLGLDTAIRKSITDRIANNLPGPFDEPIHPESLEQLGNEFVNEFKDFIKEEPGFDFGWYIRAHVTVLISSDTLISLQVDSETYTGGANSTVTTRFVNVEPATGTEYLLDAMLRPGYQEDLNRIAAEELHNQMQLNEINSMESVDPDEVINVFGITDNYGFRKEGIVFYFNMPELGSMADDPIEVIIPYEKLRDWMK